MSAPATLEDLAWWRDLAPTLRWTFARTMPQWPHWWVCGGRTPGFTTADSVRVAGVVRTFGEPGKFWRTTNLYLPMPGRVPLKAWCIFDDSPVSEAVRIVNLAVADAVYGPQEDFDQVRLDALRLR